MWTLPRLTSSYLACVSGSAGLSSPLAGGALFGASGSASATAVLARGGLGFDVEALFLLGDAFDVEDLEEELLEDDLDELLRERPVLPAIEIKPPQGSKIDWVVR